MEKSHKEGSARPRRPRTLPPPDGSSGATGTTSGSSGSLALAGLRANAPEVARFRGRHAPLAALAAQLRRAESSGQKDQAAVTAGRLARQLAKRNVELREVLGLAERALSVAPDASLTQDLATWWAWAGDSARAASLLQSVIDQAPAEERSEMHLRAGEWYARAGRETHAQVALRKACQEPGARPEAFEALGLQAFWAKMDPSEAAEAYLHAAERRKARGEEALALENLLRAFELAPDSLKVTEALARSLVARGRPGAAEEIQRAHLRLGPAAQRVAHHQRRFGKALAAGDLGAALSAAVEAELDVELDPERVREVVDSGFGARPTDFESFLLLLATEDRLGEPRSFGVWFAALLELHVSDWGEAHVEGIFQKIRARFGVAPAPRLSPSEAEAEARSLRRELGVESDPERVREVRERLALAQARLGRFTEALDAIEPLLTEDVPSLEFAAFALFVAGRSRDSVGRARALHQMAQAMPDRAGAELAAIAAELLLGEGLLSEARAAAQRAVAADSSCERAIAAQALVVLRAPEGADSGLLETSLSVLVARSETCGVLARSAERRGIPRLALNWIERIVALRPGDPSAHAEFLELAARAEDAERLAQGIRLVLASPLPLARLSAEIGAAVTALGRLDAERASLVLGPFLETASRFEECRRVAFRLSNELELPEIRALYFERELVSAPTSSRGELLIELARARAEAGQMGAAARAARRAMTREIHPRAVQDLVSSWPAIDDPDGQLALLEAEAEFSRTLEIESVTERGARLFELGVARHDMAEDPAGALDAWLLAADLDPEGGLFRLAQTLVQIFGAEQAAIELEKASRETEDPTRSGRLLGFSARAFLEVPNKAEAFRTARLAVERAPLLTDLLTVLEDAADKDQTSELGRIYEALATASLGCFGERAIRYRAARQLERRGQVDAAFEQAKGAFANVPAEGVSFVLMVRLADRLGRSIEVIELLEKIAESAPTAAERERWQERAQALADPAAIGLRQRVDILLRAATVRPEEATLRALGEAFSELFLVHPEARVELRERFKNVCEETILLSDGSHDTGLIVLLAEMALAHFGDLSLAFECLKRAVSFDLELEEYAVLRPHVSALLLDGELLLPWLDQIRRRTDQEGAPLGRALAELAGNLSREIGEPTREAELVVRAATDHPSDAALVARARELAELADRSDLVQIVEDLMPVSERARSLLARVQSMTIEESLDALLEVDLSRAPVDLRIELLEILADRQERIGRYADARDSYQDLLELMPGHDQGLRGLERLADRDQDYEELARILKVRSEVAPDPEDARRIQLRRAVVLETQLGRAVEARTVLEDLLERSGDTWAVLRVLADSWERAGDPANAAELWLRARRVAPDPESVADVSLRAARAYFEAGQAKRAREALGSLSGGTPEELELRLLVERALGDGRAILDTLVALAAVRRDEPQKVAEWLAEAADLALGLLDFERAERCVVDALATGIDAPASRLLSAQLRVRRQGIRGVSEAESVLEELRGTQVLRTPRQREIRAFLIAWAKEVIDGPNAGIRELETSLGELGTVPLLSVALAERLTNDPARALSLYESAVGGDLLHMKRAGDVLLAAGALARVEGHLDRAQALVSAVRDDDPKRPEAAKLLEEIALERTRGERLAREAKQKEEKSRDEAARAERVRRERAEAERVEAERAEAERAEAEHAEARRAETERLTNERLAREEAERARLEEERKREAARAEKARLLAEAEARKARETEERAEIARQAREAEAEARAEATRLAREERVARVPPLPETASIPVPTSIPAAATTLPAGASPSMQPGTSSPTPSPAPNEVAPAIRRKPAERAPLDLDDPGNFEATRAPVETKRGPSRPPPLPVGFVAEEILPTRETRYDGGAPTARGVARSEEELVQALEGGDVASGKKLLELFFRDRMRSRDAVVVASHLALLEPGNAETLGLLVTAAVRDGNEALALAVRHFLGAFGGGTPVAAPPLDDLSEAPDAVRALLAKGVRSGGTEALGLVWEHASGIFKRELGSYGLTGVERIPPTTQSPLAAIYRSASRILGAGRVALYRGQPTEEISLSVALTQPSAVIVSGRVDEPSPEFAFHFGAMLAAAQPEHVLLYGQAAARVQEILSALQLSFGSGATQATIPSAEVTRISSFLWQTIPPRAQRRLTQICAEAGVLSIAAVSDASRRMLRRAGLIVSGDIAVAVADASAETGLGPPASLAELEQRTKQNPRVLDLVQFALSAEYAEIRFRTPSLHTTSIASRR